MNRKVLIGLGVFAGLAQVVAGVVMYLAGVPESLFPISSVFQYLDHYFLS